MKKLLGYLLLATSLLSCDSKPGHKSPEQLMVERIEQQLAGAPHEKNAFLSFNYGDDKSTLQRKAAQLLLADRRESTHQVQAPFHEKTLLTYSFTEPQSLQSVTWDVVPRFHNDTLIWLTLHANTFKNPNYEMWEEIYGQVRDKYAGVYGAFIVLDETECVFIKGEKQVTLKLNKLTEFSPFLTVSYQNNRLMRNYYNMDRLKYDDEGNSYDAVHYKLKQDALNAERAKNRDRI